MPVDTLALLDAALSADASKRSSRSSSSNNARAEQNGDRTALFDDPSDDWDTLVGKTNYLSLDKAGQKLV